MRFAFAAALALLSAAPSLAGSTSSIHVGLIVTGSFPSSLVGSWHSRTAARGTIYHFVVGGSSGAFYQLVSIPSRQRSQATNKALAGRCDLRVSGVIYSLEQTSGQAARASYEMQYAIQSAEIVTSSTDFDDCKAVAAAYLSDIPAADSTQTLILSKTGEGRLIDNATGTDYIRTR